MGNTALCICSHIVLLPTNVSVCCLYQLATAKNMQGWGAVGEDMKNTGKYDQESL